MNPVTSDHIPVFMIDDAANIAKCDVPDEVKYNLSRPMRINKSSHARVFDTSLLKNFRLGTELP